MLQRCLWVVSSITRPLLNARHMLPIPPSGDTIWEAKRSKQLVFVHLDPPDEPLFVGLRPVAEAQYNDLTATRPFSGDGSAPVVGVSWYDAVDFCNALSEKEGLRPYYEKVLGGVWGFRKPWGVKRDADADGFRLSTTDEIRQAYGSRQGVRLFDPDSRFVEWCDNPEESEGKKAAALVHLGEDDGSPGNGAPNSQGPHRKDKTVTFRVVKGTERGLSLTSADESFSDETRQLIAQIEGTGNVTSDQARVQALLLQTVRHLQRWTSDGALRLAGWCLLGIALWMVIAAVAAALVLFVFPDALLEPLLYILGGAAIVAVAVVRLTQFDTSVHFAPPEPSPSGNGGPAAMPQDEAQGGDRKNDRFRLGRLDDVFDPSMLVGLWALVGVLLGVQIAIALRMDQAADLGGRLWNACLFALDTTAGGLLLNSLDTLGLRLGHETGVPSALTLGLRFMTFGLVCWAIGWNIVRVRLLYVQGLFGNRPDATDASLENLEAWLKAKAAEFWFLPNAYADETAFLSLAVAFARGDYAYVRTLSGDFHGVNVTEDVRLLFRDPDGVSTFAKGWKPGWKREAAQWMWSAARTQAAWLWHACVRVGNRAKSIARPGNTA